MSTTDLELPEGQELSFSLEFTPEQRDIRDWVHGFAADVVRPAGSEWDERLVIARAISGLQIR